MKKEKLCVTNFPVLIALKILVYVCIVSNKFCVKLRNCNAIFFYSNWVIIVYKKRIFSKLKIDFFFVYLVRFTFYVLFSVWFKNIVNDPLIQLLVIWDDNLLSTSLYRGKLFSHQEIIKSVSFSFEISTTKKKHAKLSGRVETENRNGKIIQNYISCDDEIFTLYTTPLILNHIQFQKKRKKEFCVPSFFYNLWRNTLAEK